MRYEYLGLCLVLSIGLTISSVAAEKGSIIIARSAPKPTSAPLLTSTPRPPLDGANPTSAPTKAPAKAAVVIIDAPPKLAAVEVKKEMPVKEDITAEKITEAHSQPIPTTDEPSSTQVESSAKQSTPLQVTGFITKNGNIYEVTDKNGVGMIEGRQSPDSDDKSAHVCNYGTVVIYSDVPCDQVTNVRIGEVHQQVVNTGGEPQQSANTEQQAAGGNNNPPNGTSNKVDDEEFPDFDDGLPQKQKQKRKRVNKKNPNKQRRRNGIRNRPNAVRQGGGNGNRRRQQAQRLRPQQQKRRRQQNNRNKGQQQQRRRLQQQQQKQMKKRRNQNGNRNGQQRRKYQSGESYNRRRFNANDIYDDEERRL